MKNITNYFNSNGFDSIKYYEKVKKIANEIKGIKMVPKDDYKYPIDVRTPRTYQIDDVPLRFKNLFEKAMMDSNCDIISEGSEYKLF